MPKLLDNSNSGKQASVKKQINQAALHHQNVTANNSVATHSNTTSVIEQEKIEPSANNNVESVAQSNNQSSINKSKNVTVVETITEADDEPIAANQVKKKKGIWALAEKTLRNLNSLGVKSVNGEEEASKTNSAYALTLGGLNITHKSSENL